MSLLIIRGAILAQGAGAGAPPPAVIEVRISALRCTTILARKGVWTCALRCTVILKET